MIYASKNYNIGIFICGYMVCIPILLKHVILALSPITARVHFLSSVTVLLEYISNSLTDTLMLDCMALSSVLNPSVNAVTANLEAQYMEFLNTQWPAMLREQNTQCKEI